MVSSGLMVLRLALVLALGLPLLACAALRPPGGDSGQAAPAHHAGRGFRNVFAEPPRGGFGSILRWQLGLGPKEEPPVPPADVPAYVPEIAPPDLDAIRRPDPSRIQVTWIGHSSFLVQAGGLNILTDPVYSDRVSPVSFIGPRRKAPPGIPFESLPRIDAVVISHDHYDHLDAPVIKKLGTGPRYFVPLGVGAWFHARGIERVSELDWWQTAFIGEVQFHCVPAQHVSGRSPFAFDRALWAGWVIETPAGRIYFAGDAGYSPHFREIGERRGPIRVALLPIGAYRPRWFMKTMHMDPPEAVRAHRDVGARYSVGMHWGTLRQSDEPLAEPPIYLKMAAREAGLADDEFRVLKFGQTAVFDGR